MQISLYEFRHYMPNSMYVESHMWLILLTPNKQFSVLTLYLLGLLYTEHDLPCSSLGTSVSGNCMVFIPHSFYTLIIIHKHNSSNPLQSYGIFKIGS